MCDKRTSETAISEAFAETNMALAFENASSASRMTAGVISTLVTSWSAKVCGVALDGCLVSLAVPKNKTSPQQPHLVAFFFWIEKLLHGEKMMFWKRRPRQGVLPPFLQVLAGLFLIEWSFLCVKADLTPSSLPNIGCPVLQRELARVESLERQSLGGKNVVPNRKREKPTPSINSRDISWHPWLTFQLHEVNP